MLCVALALMAAASEVLAGEGAQVRADRPEGSRIVIIDHEPGADPGTPGRGHHEGGRDRAQAADHWLTLASGCDSAVGPTSRLAQRRAFSARLRAERRP